MRQGSVGYRTEYPLHVQYPAPRGRPGAPQVRRKPPPPVTRCRSRPDGCSVFPPAVVSAAVAKVEHEVVVRRAVEDVFAYLADMSHIPEWMSEDFTSVTPEASDTGGKGTRYRYVATGGAQGVWEWSEFDQPTKLAWWGPPAKVGPGSVEGRGEYILSPVGDDTHLVVRIDPKFGGLLRLLAPLSVGQIRRKLPAQMNRLKRVLEDVRG